MSSRRVATNITLLAGGTALAWMAILSGAESSRADTVTVPAAPGDPAPTSTASPSFAPTNPVDCTDANNAINCQTPPLDSPLAPGGTAAPGSPLRD